MKFRGAEAIVETIEWNDQKVVSKTRNKRGYRHPVLEKKLVKERLRSESRIIERLISYGVNKEINCLYNFVRSHTKWFGSTDSWSKGRIYYIHIEAQINRAI